MLKKWEDFDNIYVVDYEFYGGPDPQIPVCYVAKNLLTNEIISHWITGDETKPEYPIDDKTLFIGYYTSAEMGCHIPLNFKIPLYIVDLFVEFRCLTNGRYLSNGRNLIGACLYYGLPTTGLSYKENMRDRILRGPPFSYEEINDILFYCEKDVEMTSNLFMHLKDRIDLQYALLRGRYMAEIAYMEYRGIPIDVEKLEKLRDCWDVIMNELICRVDQDYHIYEERVFKIDRFRNYLIKNSIPWKRTPTGLPSTDQEYMKRMAESYPQLKPLQELRYTMGQLRLNDLQVGKDGRNRCLLSPFSAKTSRSYPSSSQFIFANTVWIRGLIKPQKDMAISYIDYGQQEFAIAAVLSKDKNMMKAYLTGDPYIEFAKAAGAVPKNATKKTHPHERELYKTTMHAINYGQGYRSFAERVRITEAESKNLMRVHKATYPQYWEWITNFTDNGIMKRFVKTRFHWYMNTVGSSYRSIQNWPMQAHGAEILRIAICLCRENNIRVLCPVQDAILIEDTIENIDKSVKIAQQCMEQASEYIIGFKIRTEANTFKYPNRYNDPRGDLMWNQIWDIVDNHISPDEKQFLSQKRLLEDQPIDKWIKKPTVKPKSNLSKKMQQRRMMTPQSPTEKAMVQRIKKISGLSHLEVMHLVNLASDTYDLEHEIDWKHEGYDRAKERIQQKRMMKDVYVKE